MTATASDAKARRLVRLADGREGVLVKWPVGPKGRAKINIGGRRYWVDRADVVEIIETDDDDALPSWVVHERLRTLVGLLGERGDSTTAPALVVLDAHRPARRDETCIGCGHYWPCPTAREIGDERAFHW